MLSGATLIVIQPTDGAEVTGNAALSANRGLVSRTQQPERIDVVGVGGRAPHRTPVQAGRGRAALVSGGQLAEHRAGATSCPGRTDAKTGS